ncbi:DUF262 domain-containing protein, partial [Candidatus Parcubacteria bacterium]|nr:DUF262 domain-containing protein [Candidatus Parcubacteria bacterium]
LLYWYVASSEKCLDNHTKKVLKKFTYETRTSSRDFCTKLVEKGIAIEGANDTISDIIKNASWFFLSWKKDPTIKAMLVMLDAIHARFKGKSDVWVKLTDDSRPITFQYIELEDLELSDDLYIKMNARGKQLTAFENFKASFEKKIDDEEWDEGKAITETFSHKVDTQWADLFWNNAEANNTLFDKSYIKFIAGNAISSIACRKDKTEKKEEREKTIQELFNNPENVAPENFYKDAYDYLYKCLDVYSKTYKNILSFAFPFWQQLSEDDTLFSAIIHKRNPTYPQRVLFYAQTEYLLRNEIFNQEAFSNWMRVVRNIVQNSTIDSAESFIGAINLIAELSEQCHDIYGFFSIDNIKSGFASEQVKEEILKAKLIKAVDNNKTTIFNTEDTNFCKGRISFALYCINYENEEDSFDISKLSDIQSVIKEHLEKEDITNEFRRGLLTIGDNNFYNYWWSWLHAVDSPKRCLIENIEDLKNFAYNKNKNGVKEYREYLKEILNQLTGKKLNKLLDDFTPSNKMPNWKKRLIKKPKLLGYSEKHYIAIKEDNSCCYLLPKSRVANSEEGKKKCKKVK